MYYKWNPFQEIYDMQKAINSLFEEAGYGQGTRAKFPLIDILDKDDRYVVKAEIPGVCRDDTKVTVKGDFLTIEGEKKCLDLSEEAVALRSERGVGTFSRTIELPASIQADKVKATFENGILTIDLPKKEKEKPCQIEVQVG